MKQLLLGLFGVFLVFNTPVWGSPALDDPIFQNRNPPVDCESPPDCNPLPEGACQLDHGELIRNFAEEQFSELQRDGLAGMDDEFNDTTAYREKDAPVPEQGDAQYRLDIYGAAPKDRPIPPVDENDNPTGIIEYRCFGTIIIKHDCKIVMVPTDFMGAEELQRQGRRTWEDLHDQSRRDGTPMPEVDGRGGLFMPATVPQIEEMTCNRPPAFVGA